ncbi:MAG TPA: hypothetical protein VMG34_03895 [Bacteroidota bacterium]|nr:hypothetical protein [Bacteroidota bacterium]
MVGRLPKLRVIRTTIPLLLLLVVLCLRLNGQGDTRKGGWEHVKYAIYFTASDVESLLSDTAKFQETMAYFSPIKPAKVYLEGNSQGEVDVERLRSAANRFRAMGVDVVGALVPVGTNGPLVYNNPDDMATLERRTRAIASVFDTIILDDWLFTTATDEKSVKERGTQSWADYRSKLLLEQSKKHIIDVAKRVNPAAKVIIKYPNWYEGHRDNGYDVYNETLQFDQLAVGIETRTRAVHDQHIPIYSGYVFQKWFSSVAPSKWVGAWLDNYDMKGEDNDYVAQVWQAVLAQAPEIILWCGGELHHTGPFSDVYPHFREMLPEFNRVAGFLKGTAEGVPIYLPYGSTGEYNIFGYLGMAGIPLTPVGQFPTESKIAIFTLNSFQDPQLAEKMLARLRNGRDDFITWDLWQKLQNTEFGNTLSLVDAGGTVTSSEFRLRTGWQEDIVKSEKAVTFPRIRTTTWPYVRDAAVVLEDYDYAVLMRQEYLSGTVFVLNMPENEYDLLRLPPEVMNVIRRPFLKELGVQLEGPGGVALYPFGAQEYVVYNMNDSAAHLTIRLDKRVSESGWKELVHGKLLDVRQDTALVQYGGPAFTDASFLLHPFEIAIVQAP